VNQYSSFKAKDLDADAGHQILKPLKDEDDKIRKAIWQNYRE
jgi:hypothetical protein